MDHSKKSNSDSDGLGFENFAKRHLGPSKIQVQEMLQYLGHKDLSSFVRSVVPSSLFSKRSLELPQPLSEFETLRELRGLALANQKFRSFIGMGYSDCIVPSVIQRNILENPGWYTQYTPYQSEIAQGRLEALLNFQTLVSDLTGLPVANASLLDEATAVAEAVALCFNSKSERSSNVLILSQDCHPQTLEVVQGRAEPLGIEVQITPLTGESSLSTQNPPFAIVLQYPSTEGKVGDFAGLIARAHQAGTLVIMACDLLGLVLLKSPGELGADVAVGNSQRFGVPLGYGGPHAAFLATRDDFKRKVPGRIVGVSKDADGQVAYRLALQTREQHIRREKATSNICTAQVLLAVMASMYAVYHGPEGLRVIARRIHGLASLLGQRLKQMGYELAHETYFDTLKVSVPDSALAIRLSQELEKQKINLRVYAPQGVPQAFGIALDEATTTEDLEDLLKVFERGGSAKLGSQAGAPNIPASLERKTTFLEHSVFNEHHSETAMLRYIRQLESRDLSLCASMIPLGSCTMKLNATTEMFPVSWPEIGGLHPFAPLKQTQGYQKLFKQLEEWLSEITGFDAVSLQPNAGSQGEYAGLLVIKAYQKERGESQRDICLIPKSAHGTNPASAAMAGLKVVVVDCDDQGNVDLKDLQAKAHQYASRVAALMVTYPSTHGVFEESIREICTIVHRVGGQVYMDGANLNAQVGLMRPGEFGPDVCHLNLHKTFCIPHGGGGPGMGPIAVKTHLAPYLPGHPIVSTGGEKAIRAVSAAPWGSASILPISWAYIRMMGAEGLTQATQIAILNANYMAKKLDSHYPVLYKGQNGLVAHECIVDLRPLKTSAGIEVEDVAKRLMDYGFHAPTVSFPVPGTMMIEPTESESKAEMDRFCEALISIRKEIAKVEKKEWDSQNNPLKKAPHTARCLAEESWNRPYSRTEAVFPASWTLKHKFWPAVARIDNVWGDRNLICSCPPIESFAAADL